MNNKFLSTKTKKILAVVSATVLITFSGCESLQRGIKDKTSDFTGGLNRTITVYDYNGNVIRQYEGKCDIEENENKVLFDMDGKRTIIYNAIVIAQEN